MLVLVSSGARPRYRDDIVRALALPSGADLQFRYDRTYVDDLVARRIDGGGLRNEPGIILYLWSDRDKLETEFVRCRFVTIANAEFEGSSCIVTLRVGGFVSDLDDAKLRSLLDSAEKALLPSWEAKTGTGSVLKGKFFFSVHADLTQRSADSTTTFEATATALVRYKDFAAQQRTIFYTVRRLVKLDGNRKTPFYPIAGGYKLSSGGRYEMQIYCFLPRNAEPRLARLHIDSDVKAVEFPLGETRDIDSRYDLKQFSLQVARRTETVSAGLHLYITGPGDEDKPHSDILIPVSF